MHSFIITGGSPPERQEKIGKFLRQWQVKPFDKITLTPQETPSISISQVRQAQSLLMLKPYTSTFTALIITSAESLTLEAQQALLKTLEEPPAHGKIILDTVSPETLLPTILSRCQLINLPASKNIDQNSLTECFNTLTQIFAAPKIGERFKIIDSIAPKRELAEAFVEQAILTTRQILLDRLPAPPNLDPAKLLRRLLAARLQLKANVNPKLVLDQVFI